MNEIAPYLLIVLMLALSACFSGTEMAYNACNKMRIKKKAEESKSKSAKLAYSISEKFTNSLSALLIGNNLTNTAASAVATLIVVDLMKKSGMSAARSEAVGSVVAIIVITLIMLIFSEIVPKILARQHADALVVICAYPLRILTIILSPVVLIVTLLLRLLRKLWGKDESDEPTVTEDEISSIIETVEEEGVIDEEKSDLLQSTLDFADTTVQEILTPRIDLVSIDIDDDREKILETISESRHSRIPVYEESIDNIIGILYLNHFYKKYVDDENFDLRSILMKPFFLHKTVKLPVALSKMRDNKNHISVVVDEYGGTMGIVTMEDILEQIVGDIWDESDEIEPDYEKTGDNTYDVSGDMNIYDFFELLEIDDDDFESEYTTVGGWAIEMLDGQPHEGDGFSYKNIYVVITQMDDLRVTDVSVVVNAPEKEEDD